MNTGTGPRPLTLDERAVLDALLATDASGFDRLREQAADLTAAAGCECGCGTVDLFVLAGAERSGLPDGPAADATVNDPNGGPLGEVLLFVADGHLDRLEVAAYDEPLPMPPVDRLALPRQDTEAPTGGTAHDAVASRLRHLRHDLERTLGEHAQVTANTDPHGESVSLTPTNEAGLGVLWTDFGSALQVETAGGLGGRWELPRDDAAAEFLEQLVRAVVAGHVREVSAGDRSLVEVTLADGTVVRETGSTGLRSLLPKPGWKRTGEQTQYEPYKR